MVEVSRRDIIILGGGAIVGAVVGGFALTAVSRERFPAAKSPQPSARLTADSWIAGRQAPYFVAQRGVADVVPEHTLVGYQTALQQGAEAIEISVAMSKDRVLYCLEDPKLDRTTTLTGSARSRTSAELDRAKVSVPRLGPAWMGPNMLPIPRLEEVLPALAGRAVLCVQATEDDIYAPMLKMLESAGLRDSVVVKAPTTSPRLREAKRAGYPVAAQFRSADAINPDAIRTIVRQLDTKRDAIILPAGEGKSPPSPDQIRQTADSGVATWMSPVHRRSQLIQYRQLGVAGMVTPGIGYLSSATGRLTNNTWANGAISPGELTKDPLSNTYALDWAQPSAIGLGFTKRQAFVTLGQFCPISAPSYRITFDLAFDPLPSDRWQNASIAFGHEDDRYYEHRSGTGDGYHAMLRANGSMVISAHFQGDPNGHILAEHKSSAPLVAGAWSRMTLDVTPDSITWARDDGTRLTARDRRFRGGYFHIGRSSVDGELQLRNLSIT